MSKYVVWAILMFLWLICSIVGKLTDEMGFYGLAALFCLVAGIVVVM